MGVYEFANVYLFVYVYMSVHVCEEGEIIRMERVRERITFRQEKSKMYFLCKHFIFQ